MAASNAKFLVSMALTLCAAKVLGAAHPAAAQPIILDAQSADYSNNNVVFRRIRISQGTMSISADLGQGQGAKDASQLNFDDSVWLFRGNVKITIDDGELTSDDAQIKFLKQQLATAVANGKPAAFQKHIAKTGKLAQGHADTIDYDVTKGIVRLTKNGWLTDCSYEERADSLKYNMITQTMNAEGSQSGTPGPSAPPGSDQDSQRVHITVPPPATKP